VGTGWSRLTQVTRQEDRAGKVLLPNWCNTALTLVRTLATRSENLSVNSAREIYLRFRLEIHEGAKFLVVGAFGTVITFAVVNVMQQVNQYVAITVATALATVATYLGNRYWAFKDRQGKGTTRDSMNFLVLNGIGLLIFYGCLGLADLGGFSGRLWNNLAVALGTGLGTLFRFWSYRKWVWVAHEAPRLAHDGPVGAAAQPIPGSPR
jgi:putative flippase GtrA